MLMIRAFLAMDPACRNLMDPFPASPGRPLLMASGSKHTIFGAL